MTNIERLTSNIEWENRRIYKDFLTSIKTAVRQAHGPERSRRAEKNQGK